MANPSLQIGNGKFAIKENDLLGYSSSGTRFFPIPITMTRATLGTRVNPSGLIENVELLGNELVIDGDFPTPNTEWDLFNGATISGGKANIVGDGSSAAYIIQNNVFESNKLYKCVFDVTINSGLGLKFQDNIHFSRSESIGFATTSGVYTFYFNSTSYNQLVILRRTGGTAYDSSVTNVSVKEVIIDGLARVDYTDGTGSLLVEPQRTNLITYSEDFSQSYWTKAGSTVEIGFTSPDGTENAYKLKEDLNTSAHSLYRSNFSANTLRTFSVFAKASEKERISIYDANKFGKFIGVIFNLTSGIVESNQDNSIYLNPKIELISNGWYKCSVTWQNAALQVPAFAPAILSTNVYTGDGVSGIYVYGAQFEEGSYPTSYIKTQGSTVTRNQDQYTKTGISDKIGQTEGTFFIELSKPVLETDNYYLISLNNAASNSDSNSVTIGFDDADDDFYIRLKASGINTFLNNTTSSLANTFYKIAVAYKTGQSKIYINGSPINPNQGSLSNTFTFAVTLDNLSFDYNGNGTLPFRGNVRQLQVFKTALSDSELATLTT